MNNGTIWGHGGYPGPDYSATALHQIGVDTREAIAQRDYSRDFMQLTEEQRAAVSAMAARALKLNHYATNTGTLKLDAPDTHAKRQQLKHWQDSFLQPQT